MKGKELIDLYNKSQNKLKEVKEELQKGNPLYYDNRPLSVFEMVQLQYRIEKAIKDIKETDCNYIMPTIGVN